MKTIQTINHHIDLSDFLTGKDEIIDISISNKGIDLLLIHTKPMYRISTPQGTFSKIKSDKPKDFSFLRIGFDGGLVQKNRIPQQYFNFHYACYLPAIEELVLVSARCRYHNADNIDRNARVFDLDGNFKRDFVMGDGINDIKVDTNDQLWTAYFDEGIFGNYGWELPIGMPGLIAWDHLGNQQWAYEPIDGLNYMADCYAINIGEDNSIWFYFYTEFPLVQLNNQREIKFWETDLRGAGCINVWKGQVLFSGGYQEKDFHLYKIVGQELEKLEDISFQSSKGKKLQKRDYIRSTGATIGFLQDKKVYYTNLAR